jgi:hypothetical protein
MGGRFKGVGGRRGLVKKFEAPAAPMITSALLLSSGSQLFKKTKPKIKQPNVKN